MAQWLKGSLHLAVSCSARTMSSGPRTKLSIITSPPFAFRGGKKDRWRPDLVASSVSFLSYFSSRHDSFFGLCFLFSSSTIQRESALMSGPGFGVFAGQYVMCLSSSATSSATVMLLLSYSCICSLLRLLRHGSSPPLYMNQAISVPISTFKNVKSSHADNDCSSFTACRRPNYHGLCYTSSSLYQFWLANPLRHHYLRPWPRRFLPALIPVFSHSLPTNSLRPFVPPRRILIACAPKTANLASHLERGVCAV